MANRLPAASTITIKGRPVEIERVPGLLVNRDGEQFDVLASPSSSTIYVRGGYTPTFADGLRVASLLAERFASEGEPDEPERDDE